MSDDSNKRENCGASASAPEGRGGSPPSGPIQRYLDGAVLDPRGTAEAVRLTRHACCSELSPFVRHFWFVRWDLLGQAAREQETLPLPAANAVVERHSSFVYGPHTRRFVKRLEGSGAAFGVLFHSTGLSAFWKRPMHELTDARRPFAEVFGRDAVELRTLGIDGADDADLVSVYERFLLALRPTRAREAELVRQWVECVEREPTITGAERLAQSVGVTLRTLQRGFRRHVGVGPKHVIRRYRLLEAAGRIVRGEVLDQTRLALELGYSDQSHFIRDFTSMIGTSPGLYAAAQRPRSSQT